MPDDSSTAQNVSGKKVVAFQGVAGNTRRRAVQLGCDCGHTIRAELYDSIDVAANPQLLESFRTHHLQSVSCPACDREHDVAAPLTVHDPRVPIMVLVLPGALRDRELQLTAAFLQTLAAEECDIPQYAKRPLVVYDIETLTALLGASAGLGAGHRDEVQLRARETLLEQREEVVLAREEDLLAREEKLVAAQDLLSEEERRLLDTIEEIERERTALRALAVDLAARESALRERGKAMPPPLPPGVMAGAGNEGAAGDQPAVAELPRPAEEVDRWRAGDDATRAVLHEGNVLLLARPGTLLERLRHQEPTLLVQLHLVEDLPIITLVLQPADGGGEGLFTGIDIRVPSQQTLLQSLQKRFRVAVDLYDDESRAVTSWLIETPLEDNVALVLERANGALAALGEGIATNFTDAMRAFNLLGQQRLGKKQHNFSDESFVELPSPAATRLALGIVSYWSQPQNEEYLLLIKSFPAPYWRGIQRRVIGRAMEVGLRLAPELLQRAQQEGLVTSSRSYLRAALSNFAELSLRLKASDLELTHEWENWRQLLADCVTHRVDVEPQIEELAAGVGRRVRGLAAGVEDESSPGGDLGLLSEERLLALLEERGQRRDAALELCARGCHTAAKPIYLALGTMTRDEVARVIPGLVQLGASADLLAAGLAHRKSFIRQGCALALGAMKDPGAAAPLTKMLLAEPTRIWMEAARALGDLGAGAVAPLLRALESADGEGRERISWALAHAALSAQGRELLTERIGALAGGATAKAGERALSMLEFVRRNDAEVRGDKPLTDHTIVRRFSRSFFQTLSGGPIDVNELSDADIVEQEELLGDSDILSEDALYDSRDDIMRVGSGPEAAPDKTDLVPPKRVRSDGGTDSFEVDDSDIVDAS